MATNKKPSFTMYRGDTKSWRLEFPYDITGMQFSLTVKENIDDPNSKAVISVLATVGDDVADDSVNGIVNLTIESTDSSKLTPATYQVGIGKIIPNIVPKVTTLIVADMEVLADVLQN